MNFRFLPIFRILSTLFTSVTLLLFVLLSFAFADEVTYFYDDAGRLVATVSETGGVTTYTYDQVGNLLSISKDSFSPNPPTIQSINPDILFIGTTTLVSITGQNLLTTKRISSSNPLLTLSIITVTNSEIKVEITAPLQASPGIADLTVTTQYGSASTQTTLTRAQLSFGPTLLCLTPGSSGTIMASISPLLGRAETVQIKSSDFSIVSVPQSVTISANGTAAFSVNALREGVAYITSGSATATVIVTTSTFTPVSGEQLTIKGGPVSVYMDAAGGSATTQSPPFSALIDLPAGTFVAQSIPLSVLIDSPSGSATVISTPVSTKISP